MIIDTIKLKEYLQNINDFFYSLKILRAIQYVNQEHYNFLGQMHFDKDRIYIPYNVNETSMEIVINENGDINYYLFFEGERNLTKSILSSEIEKRIY